MPWRQPNRNWRRCYPIRAGAVVIPLCAPVRPGVPQCAAAIRRDLLSRGYPSCVGPRTSLSIGPRRLARSQEASWLRSRACCSRLCLCRRSCLGRRCLRCGNRLCPCTRSCRGNNSCSWLWQLFCCAAKQRLLLTGLQKQRLCRIQRARRPCPRRRRVAILAYLMFESCHEPSGRSGAEPGDFFGTLSSSEDLRVQLAQATGAPSKEAFAQRPSDVLFCAHRVVFCASL